MRRHETHPEWLVDDRGHVWRHERVFGCPNHPYGPAREELDEHAAVEWVARCLLDELDTEAVKTVAPGVTSEQIEQARQELGMCCRGHRWSNTGRLLEVSAFEQFVYANMQVSLARHRDTIKRSILLDEINETIAEAWQGTHVRIPLHVHAGTPLPRSEAAKAADDVIDGPH